MAERGRGAKTNHDKNFVGHKEWMEQKKQDRPYQQYNPETKTWSKIMLPKKVAE